MGQSTSTSQTKTPDSRTPFERGRRSPQQCQPLSWQSAAGNLALQYSAVGGPFSSAEGAQWSFDPYLEDTGVLTNLDLINGILDTEDWLAEHKATEPDSAAYKIRRDRLEQERKRRVKMGHVWLQTVHMRQSFQLYQLIPGVNNAIDVVRLDNDTLAYGPAEDISDKPIMTEPQFRGSMSTQGVPTVSLAEYRARLSGDQPAIPGAPELTGLGGTRDLGNLTPGVAGATAYSNVRSNLLMEAFSMQNINARQGAIGEVYFGTSRQAGYGFNVIDYNRLPWVHPTRGTEVGNFPLIDYRVLLGDVAPEKSVKTRRAVSANPFVQYATYLKGMTDILNTTPGYRGFGHFMRNAARGRSAAELRRQSQLVVNGDDVLGFRQFLSDPFAREVTASGQQSQTPNYQRAQIRRIYDGLLRDTPFTVNGEDLNTVAQLDEALASNRITADQHRAALTDLGRRAADKVVPNVDLNTATLNVFNIARANAHPDLSARQVRELATPEYMYSLGRGGGWSGDLAAMRSYGGKAALFSAGLGALRESYDVLTDERAHPDAARDILYAAGAEGLRGGTTASLEALAASRVSRYTLERGLAASTAQATALRLGSRFGPGGMVEAGFETYHIVTEDRPHSGREVGYRLSRAFVIGGTSTLAAATTGAYVGAAVGSVVPGLGTVIGFVVGLVVGAIVGAIMSSIIPSYEEMVMEQVPLKEFEKNIETQTPQSIQNQVLAAQELELLTQYVHAPEVIGPYLKRDLYQRRNLSTSPGFRRAAEMHIGGQVHGGCYSCHVQKDAADYDARFGRFNEARMAPVNRMYLAAMEEAGRTGYRPKFMEYDVPSQQVPEWMHQQVADLPSAEVIARSIDVIQPNLQGWMQIMGGKSAGIVPTHVMNAPGDEQALYDEIRTNINRKQWFFELLFNEVGPDEYKMYRDALKKYQEEHPAEQQR